jgi:hypothetical protein
MYGHLSTVCFDRLCGVCAAWGHTEKVSAARGVLLLLLLLCLCFLGCGMKQL